MFARVHSDRLRKALTAVFEDINNAELLEEHLLDADESRLRDDLIVLLDPIPLNDPPDDFEDFEVAAVDGSGTDSLAMLNDVRVHFFTTATSVLRSNIRSDTPFTPVSPDELAQTLGPQPHFDVHWNSTVRGDAKKKLAEILETVYEVEIEELIRPFFDDDFELQRRLRHNASNQFDRFKDRLIEMEDLIGREQILSSAVVHEEVRKAMEYAAARRVLESDLQPKYLLLDGALSVFISQERIPVMPSGFMLRHLCALAREKGTVLCAVSKGHSVPFAHRIARMAIEKWSDGSGCQGHASGTGACKWFCLLPGRDHPSGGLNILKNRPYIPPHLAIPYLFSFSEDNRPSRVDFDWVWWRKEVFVEDDNEETHARERKLFRDLELMSRDARWYGYPVPLALAHVVCELKHEDVEVLRQMCREVRHGAGLDDRPVRPLREDYGL